MNIAVKVAWWAGFLGMGVTWGACSGYSSLGEVPGGGGESGMEDGVGGTGMGMGAKGGQGRGGTRATGGTGMGASPGMTGGTAGSEAVGGTGMGAVAGTEMGMGAVGGGAAPACMTDADCPTPPPNCVICNDGTPSCPSPVCIDSACGFEQPECPGGPDHPACMTDLDCPVVPCMLNPDGTTGVCPIPICAGGYCGITYPMAEGACDGRACGDMCMRPDGTGGACDAAGACVDYQPMCAGSNECETSADCTGTLDCLYCGENECADFACLDGQCQLVCPTEAKCESTMDCPKETDDPCTTGPWECPDGACVRRYEMCSAPMP